MQEPKITQGLKTEELTGRIVTLFLQSEFIILSGNWYWDMAADAVFCSDVMFSFPTEFYGVKGLIHPDDAAAIKTQLAKETELHLEFRIITSYGEVKTIVGEKIGILQAGEGIEQPESYLVKNAAEEILQKKDHGHLQQLKEIYERTERFTNTGIWWYNETTNQSWYSAQVYRIFDLPPFSLNAHLNTFSPFIHPEDRETVIEFVDKAYREQAPLHLEYRIVTANGGKYILHTSQWFFNSKGQLIMSGTFQDVTEQKQRELQLEDAKDSVQFYRQQIALDEQTIPFAHWYVNLLTRKTVYSDNYYRIFGIRPKAIPAGLAGFINYIHPEDRETVSLAHRRMMNEHKIPELEFRIVRTDGKTRYISQKAKQITDGNDLVMIGTIHDVTVQKILEKKLKEFSEAEALKTFIQAHVEEMAGIVTWVRDAKTSAVQWSEQFYKMFGLKPGQSPSTEKELVQMIHPEDRKVFSDEVSLALQQKKETSFTFRMLQRGKERNMKASIRIMHNEEKEYLIGILQDVTTEYIMQKELNQRVQLAKALSENVLDRIIITDANHTILVWNKPCEEAYGAFREDVIGKNFFDVFPKLKTEEELVLFSRVLKGESIFVPENKSLQATGYYDLRLLPLWDEDKAEVNGIIHIIHDVTKEMELRQTLNERLSFIENLVESSVDCIIAIDRNLNYMVWNKKCEEYYGLRKEQVIGKNVLEVFPSGTNTPGYDELRRVLRGETIYFSSDKNEEKDYHEAYLIPVKNQKGEISAILWISHDLSKEYELQKHNRRADETIKQTHQLQRIMTTIPDMVSIFELETNRFTFLNVETFMAHGFEPKEMEEIDRKQGLQLVHPDDHTVLANYFTSFINASDDNVVTAEYRAKNKNDEWKWFFVRGKVFQRNEEGKVTHVLNAIEDITDRKNAEQKVKARTSELRQNKEFVEAITNTIPDVVTIVENATGKIEFANHDAMEQLGFGAEEIVTMSAEDRRKLLHPDDVPAIKKYYEDFSLLSGEEENRIEYRVKNKKGDWIWLSIRGRPFKRNEKGECTHSLNICRDITAYKNAEAELRKNLTLLHYTEYLAQSGTWEYEIETGNFNWSNGMYKLFGLPEKMKVRPEIYLDHSLEEDRSIAKKIINRLKKEHDPFEEVMRIKRNGDVRTLKIKGSVLHDETGKLNKIVGVDVDITDIRKTEEQLKESRHWLEETAKASPDSITIYDLQKKQPVYLNNCLAQWTGTTVQQLIEMGIEGRLKLVHEDDRLKLLQFNSRLAHANDIDILKLEYRIKKDDGSFMWIHNRSKVFQRDGKGNVTHILSFLQNVTEEIQLREELKRRTEYAETIFDSSVDRITVFDCNYRFVAWNKRCSQVHGWTKEQVLGKSIFELFPDIQNCTEIITAQQAALKGEAAHVSLIKDECTNGYMEMFYVPLKNEKGETYAVVNIIHDVTDYVKNTQSVNELNKALESKNAELAQKNEEINHFAFVASHDMKEPLRKIQTFSDWLLQQETEQLSPKGRTLLEKMNIAVKRMDVLLEDILVLTKIHSDHHSEDVVDLNKVLSGVKEDMADALRKTQTTIEADQLLTIKGNANQVFYLFKNLISNAIKFQRPGNVPHVKITAEIVKGNELNVANAKDEYGKISFIDNGFGFEQKYAKKIFQVFQRLHGKHEFEGTGIGLAICRKIMENHHGTIEVQSEQGKGSTFTCYFPLT